MGSTLNVERQGSRTNGTQQAGGRARTTPSGGRGGAGAQSGQRSETRTQQGSGEGLANFLGWFSVGLGLAELVAPGGLARLIGIEDDSKTRNVMRAYGVRELAAGVGILSQEQPATWVWSRVAGDAVDLMSLTRAMNNGANSRGRTMAATAAVLGVTALDIVCATQLTRAKGGKEPGVHVQRALTINRPLDEVFRFWHNFENFPRFMKHLESVTRTGGNRSHWTARGPAGVSVEWDAEMTEDRENELISWRSVSGADVENFGSVRFVAAPGRRGTEIHVDLRYAPPAGKAGALFAKLFHEEPGQQVQEDLRRFKQIMEVGEIVLSDASAHWGMHAAQPDGPAEQKLAGRMGGGR